MRKFKFHDGINGVAFKVHVTTRSKKAELKSLMEDGTLKIHLTSAPIDGKANNELISIFAKVLDVPKSWVEIVAGITGKNKIISVINISPDIAIKKIHENLSHSG